MSREESEKFGLKDERQYLVEKALIKHVQKQRMVTNARPSPPLPTASS
jgi:hypothetical protein